MFLTPETTHTLQLLLPLALLLGLALDSGISDAESEAASAPVLVVGAAAEEGEDEPARRVVK